MTTRTHLDVVTREAFDGLAPMQDGRAHQVDLVWCRSNLFGEPVIVTSDLHKDALQVFEHLAGAQKPDEWHVVTCGDMAGTTQWGEDATPLPMLEFILDKFRSLHFVLGNHDTTSAAITGLRNSDGRSCCLDGQPRELAGRRICGVSGIMGQRSRPGRLAPDLFVEAVTEALSDQNRQSVLFTHETPRLSSFQPCIGQDALTDAVQQLSPAAHFFGHCHLEPIALEDHGTLFVNVDGRVLLIEPV